MTFIRPLWLLATILILPQVCTAGIGMDTSALTFFDTRPPVLQLDPIAQDLLIQAGDQVDFHWTSGDENPGMTPGFFTASILVDQQPIETISWYPHTEEFTWNWNAPEIQTPHCQVEVTARDAVGNTTVAVSDYFTVLFSTTAVGDIPSTVRFEKPYPNPFNPSCELTFSLPNAENISLAVFDARGHKIATLREGTIPAGTTTVRWNGTNQKGLPQSAGVYFFVLQTNESNGAFKLVRKATLVP